ncbi:MAG TPA: acyl-CoA dehydrogenase N-terminal domain-containing protein, partial [Aquirhabdus sp.]
MPQYKAPVRDIQFVMHELLNFEAHYDALPAYAGTNRELIDGVLEAAADFCENELAPIN